MKLNKKQKKELKKVLKLYEIKYDLNEELATIYIRKTRDKTVSEWNRGTIEFQLCYEPTGNCQLMSLSNLENLFELYNWEEEYVANALIKIVFSTIKDEVSCKQVMLTDIREEFVNKEFRQFLRQISNFVPTYSFVYKSSNSTTMRSTISKLDKVKIEEGALMATWLYNIDEGTDYDFDDIYAPEDDD